MTSAQFTIDLSSPSSEAHDNHVASGKLAANESEVFDLVESHPLSTANELARATHLTLTEVRRRLSGLARPVADRRPAMIKAAGKRACRVAGSNMYTWEVP